MVNTKFQLQEDDVKLLRHVALHKMTTHEIVALLPEMDGISVHAAKKRLQRLRTAGYLESAHLMEKRVYYHLSRRGAKYLDLTVKQRMHLSQSGMIRAYAGLVLCTDPRLCLEKKTPDDMQLLFPEIQLGQRDFYLNKSVPERTRLGLYRVDYSPGSRRWSYIIPNIEQNIAKLCNNDGFRQLVINGQAEMTLVTALQDKADALASALHEADIPTTFPIKFYVIEDLLPLVAPQQK